MSKERPESLLKTDTKDHVGARARGEILSESNGLDEKKVLKPGENDSRTRRGRERCAEARPRLPNPLHRTKPQSVGKSRSCSRT
jgi:hypothetical protein